MSPESTDKQTPSGLHCSLLPSTLTCQYKHDTIQISSLESTLICFPTFGQLKTLWLFTKLFSNYNVILGFNDIHIHSTKSELRFCAGSNLACGMSEIRNGGDL